MANRTNGAELTRLREAREKDVPWRKLLELFGTLDGPRFLEVGKKAAFARDPGRL